MENTPSLRRSWNLSYGFTANTAVRNAKRSDGGKKSKRVRPGGRGGDVRVRAQCDARAAAALSKPQHCADQWVVGVWFRRLLNATKAAGVRSGLDRSQHV